MPPTFAAGSSVKVFSTACSSTSDTCAPDSRMVTTFPSCGTICRNRVGQSADGFTFQIAIPTLPSGQMAMHVVGVKKGQRRRTLALSLIHI